MASQAVKGLVPLPTVAKPHKSLAALARSAGEITAPGAKSAGPVPATVAAGTLLALVPEAPDEFGVPDLRVRGVDQNTLVYSCLDHRSSFYVWSVVLAPELGLVGLLRGLFLCPPPVLYYFCLLCAILLFT